MPRHAQGFSQENRESTRGGLALITAMEKKNSHTSISFTAGRHKLPCEYRISGEGDTATATAYVMLHGGIQFTVDLERWQKFLSDLNGNPPLIFLHNNRAKGKGRFYLAVVLPQGKQMKLARVLYEKEARGKYLRYHDKNPFNLTRENIVPIKSEIARAEAKARGLA